jgi:hypothetical protein
VFLKKNPTLHLLKTEHNPAAEVGTMFSIEEFIIAVFWCVDDLLIEITQGRPIRKRGFAAALVDSEVITMEIVAEFLGIDANKDIWKYFHRHWLALFPNLHSRFTFVRQAANLWQVQGTGPARLSRAARCFWR